MQNKTTGEMEKRSTRSLWLCVEKLLLLDGKMLSRGEQKKK